MKINSRKTNLVSASGIYVAANIINSLIPFALLPVLTRYLSPSEYGEVAVYQVWIAMIASVCGFSVHGAALRKYYDDTKGEMAEFISSCIFLLIISSIIVIGIVSLIGGTIYTLIGINSQWLLLGVLTASAGFVIQLRLGQWQVRNQPINFGTLQVTMSIVNMLLSVFLVVILSQGTEGRVMGISATACLFSIISLILLRLDGLLLFVWRKDLIIEALKFGIPLLPHVLGSFLLLSIDKVVISHQLGLEYAGYYMVAAQLAMVLGILLEGINKAYTPWLYDTLAKDNYSEKVKIVKLTYYFAFFLSVCVALTFAIGDKVLIFIAGEQYSKSVSIIGWLVLAKAFHGMYFMSCGYIFYKKETLLISKITLVSGAINLVLLFILLEKYGILGAAWAMCLGMFVQWILTWVTASRLVQMPWRLR